LKVLERRNIAASPAQKAENESNIRALLAEIRGLDAQLQITNPFG
jgi:hypothetical protein